MFKFLTKRNAKLNYRQLAKQLDEEGLSRDLTQSLLLDLCLPLHPRKPNIDNAFKGENQP
jgi:hypothetical protein